MAKLIIGSRGSQLALTQTHHMRNQLCAAYTDLEVRVEVIRTTGDESRAPLRSFGGQGVFTKELENALLDGRVDLAVHSLKDLPTQFHSDLDIVATPPREDVRDALISNASHLTLINLPEGALVGTGSPRRQTQLRALARFKLEIRGNLETRIEGDPGRIRGHRARRSRTTSPGMGASYQRVSIHRPDATCGRSGGSWPANAK